MSAHTPGPWTYDGGRFVHSDDGTVSVICHDNGHAVPKFRRRMPADDNARLIAAAPDMLEALQKLANEVEGLAAFSEGIRAEIGNTNWGVLELRLKEARAAISKATQP